MENNGGRRNFLKALIAAPALTSGNLFGAVPEEKPGGRLKIGLNAYSFNDPLRAGTMTLDDLLDYCAQYNFDAVDLTGYYFPKYPEVPTDEYLFHIKRKAHALGLEISGTGVRNDLTNPDAARRNEDIQHIKNWVTCAAKLGAPVLRIFAGTLIPKPFTWQQIAGWMVKDIRECVAYGQKNGVIVAIQNHNDFIKTADEAIKIIKMVDSEWFGLILDTGSYRQGDPYAQIAQTAPYAVNWQVKENIFVNGQEQKTDLVKLFKVINASGYRGYLPIETLGKGDPKEKVARFVGEVRSAMAG